MGEVFASLSEVKSWLRITVATDDTLLGVINDSVTAAILTFLSRDIFQATYDIRLNGTGQRRMKLPQYPVTAVSSLKIDEGVIAPTLSSTGIGFMFDEKTIYLMGDSVFTRAFQNVQVGYTAGYTAGTMPDDFKLAALHQVGHEYRMRERIGEQSKMLGPGQTVSYIIDELLPVVKGKLERHRKAAPV